MPRPFAVILGVAFLAGTLILTDTIKGTFNGLLAKADAGTDAYVRAPAPSTSAMAKAPVLSTPRCSPRSARIDGVDQASVQVSGYAQIVDKDGKAVGTPETGVLGMNWVTVPALNPFTIASGRAPAGPDEIAIDKHSADIAKLGIGDRTTVLSTGEPRPATIVGITRFGDVDTPGGMSVVLFDDVTAQTVLNGPVRSTRSPSLRRTVSTPTRSSPGSLRSSAASNEVISGATLTKEHQDDITKDISQFGTFLTIFALIAVFVSAFIINNTFSIIVSQRTKEMALLRAVGATGRQVRRAVLAEAAVTGLVASAVGLTRRRRRRQGPAGAARARSASTSRSAPRVISTATVVISMVVGFVVTVVSAVLPGPPSVEGCADRRSARRCAGSFRRVEATHRHRDCLDGCSPSATLLAGLQRGEHQDRRRRRGRAASSPSRSSDRCSPVRSLRCSACRSLGCAEPPE